jgi:hypothetical protein
MLIVSLVSFVFFGSLSGTTELQSQVGDYYTILAFIGEIKKKQEISRTLGWRELSAELLQAVHRSGVASKLAAGLELTCHPV